MYESADLGCASRCTVYVNDVRSVTKALSGAFSRHLDMKLSSMSRKRFISARYSGFITYAERPALALWATAPTAFRFPLCMDFIISFHPEFRSRAKRPLPENADMIPHPDTRCKIRPQFAHFAQTPEVTQKPFTSKPWTSATSIAFTASTVPDTSSTPAFT